MSRFKEFTQHERSIIWESLKKWRSMATFLDKGFPTDPKDPNYKPFESFVDSLIKEIEEAQERLTALR